MYADVASGSTINVNTGGVIRFCHSAEDFTSFSEAMRIDASGNVGIGVVPTLGRLHVKAASGVVGWFETTGLSGALGISNSGTFGMQIDTASSSGFLTFTKGSGSTEFGRFDTDGNLLVGQSSTTIPGVGNTTAGVSIRGTDGSFFSRALGSGDTNNVVSINRSTADGPILGFQKDGTTVGSIGTVSTALYIANDDTGLQLYGGGATDQIVPCDGSGVTRNNTIDLGKPTGRFKDLFIGNDIGHLDAAGNARLLYDKSANLLGNAGTNGTFATLSKSSGSFKIDHPLPEKTETHYLVHSFVESPQADNIYRGKVDLVDGLAAVNIDDAAGMTEGTYVLLNTNTQCFTSNESSWTAVKGSVSGNILTITAQDNTCTDTISWMVIGERHDQHMFDTEWTDENGKVIVEPLKES